MEELLQKESGGPLAEDQSGTGEIVVYQPDDITRLEVRVEGESVWLTQAQMSDLFQKDQSVIARHIKNVFREAELEQASNMQILHNTLSKFKPVTVYSLDVIISVGYRVKSLRGTQFRRWANRILKTYLLKGDSFSLRLSAIERRVDLNFAEHSRILQDHQRQIDFFVRTSLPPVEGIFYDGQIFDAYVFVADLIRSARQSIVLIDNYIDDSVLIMLSKRTTGVSAEIRTCRLPQTLLLDVQKHNAQYAPIVLTQVKNIHDRFLIIDDTVYHIGASLKDLGRKLFAFSKMSIPVQCLF